MLAAAATEPSLVLRGSDIASDFIPAVSNIKDATIAITGVNPVTKEQVGTAGRVIAGVFAIPELGNVLKYVVKGGKFVLKGGKAADEGFKAERAAVKAAKALEREVAERAEKEAVQGLEQAAALRAEKEAAQRAEKEAAERAGKEEAEQQTKAAARRGPKTDPEAPHNKTIRTEADKLEKEGNTVVAGGGRAKERLVPTRGGAKQGRRPDILYETPAGELRGRNVGKVDAKGNPVPREQKALEDLNGPGKLPTDFVPYNPKN